MNQEGSSGCGFPSSATIYPRTELTASIRGDNQRYKPSFRVESISFHRTHATIWIARNDNLDCTPRCTPLIHVTQHARREKRKENRTRFRLCSPLLASKRFWLMSTTEHLRLPSYSFSDT